VGLDPVVTRILHKNTRISHFQTKNSKTFLGGVPPILHPRYNAIGLRVHPRGENPVYAYVSNPLNVPIAYHPHSPDSDKRSRSSAPFTVHSECGAKLRVMTTMMMMMQLICSDSFAHLLNAP